MAHSVLLVENDLACAKVISESLKNKFSRSVQVVVCRCYEEAFGYLFSEKWDLVMINYELPTRNGVETLQTFKAIMEEWKTPTIVYNASNVKEKIEDEDEITLFSNLKDVTKPEGLETIRSFLEDS